MKPNIKVEGLKTFCNIESLNYSQGQGSMGNIERNGCMPIQSFLKK